MQELTGFEFIRTRLNIVRSAKQNPVKPEIRISKVWSDVNLIELKVEVSDGASHFSNQVYVGHPALADVVLKIKAFKDQVHGGLLDVQFGEFGCEYANGAFHARFHFASPSRLYVTCRQESNFEEFAKKTVASSATMYLKSEPILLDRFIVELQALVSGTSTEAELEAI